MARLQPSGVPTKNKRSRSVKPIPLPEREDRYWEKRFVEELDYPVFNDLGLYWLRDFLMSLFPRQRGVVCIPGDAESLHFR